jgi:hypothetical protein
MARFMEDHRYPMLRRFPNLTSRNFYNYLKLNEFFKRGLTPGSWNNGTLE